MMNKHKVWGAPGWAWELELLSLVFVFLALGIPLMLALQSTGAAPDEMSLIAQAQMERRGTEATLEEQQGVFWAIAILGLYAVHLVMAFSAVDMISTTFMHLFSPFVFATITYVRLFLLRDRGGWTGIVSGTWWEIAIGVLVVAVITILMARLRMARHMRRFREVEWEVSTPTKVDRSVWSSMLTNITPLIYPPKAYHACEDGIMIEGWLYLLPLPFKSIRSIEGVRRVRRMTNGQLYATSTERILRIQPMDSNVPLYISPEARAEFLQYCNGALHRGVVSLAADHSRDDEDE